MFNIFQETTDTEDSFMYTGVENSLNFKAVYEKYNGVAAFLASTDYIGIRSTTMRRNKAELWLNLPCDIDGVTIEWGRLSGTSHTFHHLSLAQRDASSLKKVYPMLKKHDNLLARNATSKQVLKSCVGTQLFYECGWEYYLCLVPVSQIRTTPDESTLRKVTLRWIEEVRLNLKIALNKCIETRTISGTLDKNNLNDVRRIFILPKDSSAVLEMFDKCVKETNPPQDMRPCVFSFRFGEKCTEVVKLPIKDNTSVSRLCVHAAVVIEIDGCEDDDEQHSGVLWSTEGIRSVVRNRGTFRCAMSCSECSNFQSDLDGRPVDVSSDLKSVCKFPNNVHFVQLYADLPHRYPSTRFHPVSAVI